MRTKFVMLVLMALGMFAGRANAETALKFSLDFIMFGPNSPFVYADEGGSGCGSRPGQPAKP